MTAPSPRRFAGVLAHHDGRVVLVREAHSRWGGEFWNLPSGMVDAHETPAEGAARELAEEAGLRVPPGALRLRSNSSTLVDGLTSLAWNFDVVIEHPALRSTTPTASCERPAGSPSRRPSISYVHCPTGRWPIRRSRF
ncbi:MAG: NUDIX hydrolase [Actinomycetota bacterium]